MFKLSKRLETVAQMVVNSNTAADIGADHGYLICELIQKGIIKKGFAVENKKGPYTHLYDTIKSCCLEDKVIPYLGDGILPLTSNVDTLVLAGMGSDNIVKILTSRPSYVMHVPYIVCDSHTNLYALRLKMQQLGYVIDDEQIVYEANIFYEIIRFKKGSSNLDELSLKYGPILMKQKSDTFKQKYHNRITRINELLALKLDDTRKNELENELAEINKVLNGF